MKHAQRLHTAALIGLLVLGGAHGALALTLAEGGQAQAVIVVAADPIPAEETAARELADYLGQISGATFEVRPEGGEAPARAVYVGPTQASRELGIDQAQLDTEEWIIRVAGGNLYIIGGRPRGTIYAAYRFLEDIMGVRWWSPWEETVPAQAAITLPDDLDHTGKPVMDYRDIYTLYVPDNGRFAARNRLNRQGDEPIGSEYGGRLDYGPPYHVHTFWKYISPDDYFETNPEYFSMIDGERNVNRTQLCLTNREMRELMKQRLREFISRAQANAEANNLPLPSVFEISQNDWYGACQCDECQAFVEEEGAESGLLLDFVNEMADSIRDAYPDIFIGTLAYQYTLEPPKTIRPRDNVVIRLCDTTSNIAATILDEDNTLFREHLLTWAEITKHLRIWDYAVTFAAPRNLAMPSVHTYPVDYRFFVENNVQGVFTEHEYPTYSDMRAFKIWMMMKLKEDPYADYDALVDTFMNGYFGPAGPYVHEYLKALEAAAAETGSFIGWFAAPSAFRHINIDLVPRAHELFDQAEAAVADDAELVHRVRRARLALDRATAILYSEVVLQWVQRGNDPATMPVVLQDVCERYEQTWHRETEIWLEGEAQEKMKADASLEARNALIRGRYHPLPELFSDYPVTSVFDMRPGTSRNWNNVARVVEDPDADTGYTNRLELSDEELERYQLPMPSGMYDRNAQSTRMGTSIRPEDVPGPGYNWYKLGTFTLSRSDYFFFFPSWIIQFDMGGVVDPDNPDQQYEIWSHIKFEGPGFPHGAADEQNAISVERLIVLKVQ